VQAAARELDVSPAQLGIAFCLANPATANVLVGASRLAQLEENAAAVALADTVGADRIRALTEDFRLDHEVAADGAW
jgi:aryl-alcohol dehydrogenase-like predicted oxidoreductase